MSVPILPATLPSSPAPLDPLEPLSPFQKRLHKLALQVMEMEKSLFEARLNERLPKHQIEKWGKELNAVSQRVSTLTCSLIAPENPLQEVQEITERVGSLVTHVGTSRLQDFLELTLGEDWQNLVSHLPENWEEYAALFTPIEGELTSYRKKGAACLVSTSSHGAISYKEEELAKGEWFFTETTLHTQNSRKQQFLGAELCIPYEKEGAKKILIINGHVQPSTADASSSFSLVREKIQAVLQEKEPQLPQDWVEHWLGCISLRDLLARSKSELTKDLVEDKELSETLERKTAQQLISFIKVLTPPEIARCLNALSFFSDYTRIVAYSVRYHLGPYYQELLPYLPLQTSQLFLEAEKKRKEELSSLSSDPASLEEQITQSDMPTRAAREALEKVRYSKKVSGSEKGKSLEYAKRLVTFPWGKHKSLPVSTQSSPQEIRSFRKELRAKLDQRILGQERAKNVIHELTGCWISKGSTSGTCLGFEGSPGVGKTELAQSLGEAWGLPVVHISCGGLTDGSFLKGHGYTYSGSQPGKIVNGIIQAGYQNALFVIDEVDKLSDTPKGQEVAEAILELTDPTRSQRWEDSYFEGVPFPLNQCPVVLIYNYKNNIPEALWSRIANIKFDDITQEQKLTIASSYLLPKVAEKCGFQKGELILTDEAVRHLVHDYAKEPGVRKLEQRLFLVAAYANGHRLDNWESFSTPFTLTKAFAKEALDQLWSREEQEHGPEGLYI